jgi:hypothetical protein
MLQVGVLVVLGVVLVLILCLLFVLWGLVRNGRRKTASVLGIAALGIVAVVMWAIYTVAPKGGRTIAQLELADGRAFVVRHYRYEWTEYPKVRFYARDTEGAWTSFVLIAELVNPNATSLVLDPSEQKVEVAPTGGWYRIPDNDFVNIDGSWCTAQQLPPGIEPGEEDIH